MYIYIFLRMRKSRNLRLHFLQFNLKLLSRFLQSLNSFFQCFPWIAFIICLNNELRHTGDRMFYDVACDGYRIVVPQFFFKRMAKAVICAFKLDNKPFFLFFENRNFHCSKNKRWIYKGFLTVWGYDIRNNFADKHLFFSCTSGKDL